jgi:hypothetical protein
MHVEYTLRLLDKDAGGPSAASWSPPERPRDAIANFP